MFNHFFQSFFPTRPFFDTFHKITPVFRIFCPRKLKDTDAFYGLIWYNNTCMLGSSNYSQNYTANFYIMAT